jgi:uncharacterized membrane protein
MFTITGRYMRSDFPDKDEIDQTLRLLMRSRHIYILLSSLIHISLGVYLQLRSSLPQKIMQITGSIVLVISSLLLFWAFVVETYYLQGYSSYSRDGLYLCLAGVALHLIGGFNLPNRK